MDKKKPKPCPKCGNPAHVVDLISGYGTMYSVACNDPDCMFFEPARAYSTADEAVDEWNIRFFELDTNEAEDMDVINVCPFCREEAASVQKVDEWAENVEVYQVFCENCGASGPAKFSKEKAVEVWNEGSCGCDCDALGM